MPEEGAPEGDPAASPPSDEESAMQEETAAEEPAPKEPAAAETTETPEPTTAPEQQSSPAPAADPRPEDVAEWEDKDFRSAKADRDPRLLDAVAYLGENSSGDAEAATLLVELLSIPEDPEPEPKPEPKVEKKPEKKKPAEYDEYSGEEGMYSGMPDEMSAMEGEDYGPSEEDMSEMYSDLEESMYEGSGGYSQRKKQTKAPLAASYVSLTGGIIRALGANGTKEAQAALEQLLAGKVSVGKERAVAGAVLRTLIDYPCPENDKLLKVALTSPESLRPTSEEKTASLEQEFGKTETESEEGKEEEKDAKERDVDALVAASLAKAVTAEDIRDTALPLIEESASMRLRYDLAAYLIGSPSEELGPILQEWITAAHPLNVQAQIGLYRYPNTPDEMRDSFERYFTSYATSTLGRILAISVDKGADLGEAAAAGQDGGAGATGWSGFGDKPTGQSSRTRGRSPSDPGPPGEMGMEEMYEEPSQEDHEMPDMAGPSSEYSDGSGSGGQNRSYKPPKGPGEADKISLEMFEQAAEANPNIPYELASQLWGKELQNAMSARMDALTGLEEGAQLLMLAGHIPTDKMRAQLLKTLQAHWLDGPEAFAAAAVTSETGISDPGFITVIKALPRREPPARAKADPTDEMLAQYAWMETAYGTVRVFCEQFQKAAENAMVNQNEVLASLPFRTHATENHPTHVYAFDWQKQVGNRLTGAPVDPMRIYYLRFDENGLYAKAHGTYKRVVPKAAEHLVKDGLWIDGAKTGPEGRRVSMDVIIDRTDFNPDRKAVEPEPMVIQILFVEINDPNPPKEAKAD